MILIEPDGMTDEVRAANPDGASSVVLVCEHATAFVPTALAGLGLSPEAARSHAAWDPGALGVATWLSALLDAPLVAGVVSRLVCDCNRPPGAPDSAAARSEIHDVPGNAGLSPAQRAERAARHYVPFRDALASAIATRPAPVIVTIHSFTPVYAGQMRAVQIGILHDADARLADAMLASAPRHTALRVERNAPYGPRDGVTHTLQRHALPGGHPNVMIEIRNDLIETGAEQTRMAEMLAAWLAAAFATLHEPGHVACTG